MKFRLDIIAFLLVTVGLATGCDDDDTPNVTAMAGGDQSVDVESLVTLDASGTVGEGLDLAWTATAPDGSNVTITNATSDIANFRATQLGDYTVQLTAQLGDAESTDELTVSVTNVTYNQVDAMGRPGINTVFNFFGDADTKNAYNQVIPENGASNVAAFQGIFEALQSYIGHDPSTYVNVLGLDNATTASVLAVDVLNCNKEASSTYGPSDLGNISLFDNVLNGRRLQDDVIDVTLILAFFGDGNTGNPLAPGLISDGVDANDVAFSDSFPYLAAPH